MNNCPKCGNPLQAGTTSCPICGTNISNEMFNKVETSNIKVASVGQAPQTQAQLQVEQVAQLQNQSQVPSQQTQVSNAPAQEPQVVAAEHTQIPSTQQQMSAPEQVQQTTISNNSINNQSLNQQPIDPNSLAPTVPKVEMATPVPSIPASLSENYANENTVQAVNAPTSTPTTKAKKSNKKVLIVVLVFVLLLAGVGGYILMNFNTSTNKPLQQTQNEVATTSIVSNGYKLKQKDGWLTVEDGSNVIITNTSETVVIKLEHSTGNISEINEEYIKNLMSQNTAYTNTEVTTTKISAKDAYQVNTQINSLPVQVYFINGGSNLIIGVSVIYQSNDSKNKYEAEVVEMIGTLSYSDDSIKAISTIDMYRDAFSLYGNIITNRNNQQLTQQPTQQQNQQPTQETINQDSNTQVDEEISESNQGTETQGTQENQAQTNIETNQTE